MTAPKKTKKAPTKAETVPVPEKKAALKAEDAPEFTFREGFLFGVACSSLSKAETILRVRDLISGTKAGWVLADGDSLPKDAKENPYPCSDHPKTHKHYIFAC